MDKCEKKIEHLKLILIKNYNLFQFSFKSSYSVIKKRNSLYLRQKVERSQFSNILTGTVVLFYQSIKDKNCRRQHSDVPQGEILHVVLLFLL